MNPSHSAAAPNPPITSGNIRRHLGYLDSLRGIAILLVLWVHAGLLEGAAGRTTFAPFFMGQRGVELFYELSAFTLFLSLSGRREKQARLRNFYLRRFFRIAPAFYLALVVEFARVGYGEPDRWRYVLALIFLNGWSPKAINLSNFGCWSIAVEATFYLFVPLLFRTIHNFQRAFTFFLLSWCGAFAMSAILAHLLRNFHYGEYFMLLWPVAQLPVFAMGILAFRMYEVIVNLQRQQPNLWTASRRKGTSAFLLLSSAMLFLMNFGHANLFLVPGSFCFVPLLLAGDLYAWRLLFNRVTAYLGKISFSLYLVHFAVLPWVRTILDQPTFAFLPRGGWIISVIAFGLIGLLASPLSWISWRLVEVPGVALGRWIIARLEGKVAEPETQMLQPEESAPDFQF